MKKKKKKKKKKGKENGMESGNKKRKCIPLCHFFLCKLSPPPKKKKKKKKRKKSAHDTHACRTMRFFLPRTFFWRDYERENASRPKRLTGNDEIAFLKKLDERLIFFFFLR